MISERLKNSILQFAITGGFSKHTFEDFDYNEYYASNNMKKLTPKINKNLFEIPEYWRWVKIEDLAVIISKGTTPKGGRNAYVNEGVPFIRAENIHNGSVNYENISYITQKSHEVLRRSKLKKNDVLITIAGTLGRTAVLDDKYSDINTNQAVAFIRISESKNVNLKYIEKSLNAPKIQKEILSKTKTTAIPNLTLEIIRNTWIPIPPLDEQNYIVEKIEKILPLIDDLEIIEKELKLLEEKFPDRLRNSILLSAIQGGFNDKDNLRPNNNSSLISDINIPNHWKLVKLDKLVLLLGGYAFKSSQYLKNYSVDAVRVIRISDFNNFELVNKSAVYYKYDESLSRYEIKENDILLCMTGGTVGKSLLIKDVKEKMYLNQRVAVLRNKNDDMIDIEYLYFLIQSPYIQSIINESKNSTNDNISMKQISNFMIPLPPINEQKEIVERLKNIFKYI